MDLQVEVKELPEIRLAGITQFGGFDKVQESYEKLFKWAGNNGLLNSPGLKVMTIYHDNPRVTEKSKVRQSACITINEDAILNDEVNLLQIQKGKYAIGRFEIPAASFPKAWEELLIWVKRNGYEFGERDYFEVYLNDNRTHPEQKFIIDIGIPIA